LVGGGVKRVAVDMAKELTDDAKAELEDANAQWQRLMDEEKKAIVERRLKKEEADAEIERQKALRQQKKDG